MTFEDEKMAKKKSYYFDEFIVMVNHSYRAAEFLQECMRNFDPDTMEEQRKAMHEIEHAEDKIKHTMMGELAKEFVTPIDREDIISLAGALDDVTDKIDDILIRMYMYDIRELQPAAQVFADMIMRCCKTLQAAVTEFPNFHKSTTLGQLLIDVNTMEDEGDAIYIDAMHTLHTSDASALEKFVWSELFECFEDCCDACENVADLIEAVVMKNA